MAHALRVMLSAGLLALAFISSSVYAILPVNTNKVYSDGSKTYTSESAACAAGLAELRAAIPQFAPINLTSTTESGATLNCWYSSARGTEHRGFTIVTTASCPANSVKSGEGCVCNSGLKEVNNQCVKEGVCGFLEGKPVPGLPRIEADYGKQSASWAAGQIGKPGLVCTPEQCQASGTVTGCVAGQGAQGTTVCYVSEPKYTGDSCKKDDKPGDKSDDCPTGTKKSATNPNLCEPFNTSCPTGYEPSKYVEGVCIPLPPESGPKDCEDPKDPTKRVPCEGKPNNCPKGYVPSAYVKGVCIPAVDGETTDKNGDKVTCKDGKCTTTKPGGTDVTQPKEEFCAANPDNELCTKQSEDTFSGTCEMNFQCKGDVLQCAIAQEQHKRNCEFFVTPTPESGVFENARAEQQEDVLSMTAQTVDLAAHIQADPIITGSCPADMVIPVQGYDIRFPLSQFCPYFNYLGLIVMVMTAVTCLRILGKD